MKKNKFIIALGICSTLLYACSNKLDLAPVSTISDASYWKTPEQVDAFVSGLHSRFRADNGSFQTLGEMRADIFSTDPGSATTFTGEATQGLEKMWTQTLTLDNAGVSGFGSFYYNINQLNLLLAKLNTINVVTPANMNYYKGEAFGMRAFYYFQMLRTWGKVVIKTDPVTSIDIAGLSKAANSEAEVMALIKSDIDSSVNNFAADYTFRNTRSYWSKAASLMLKAEVYLWTSHRNGGAADATTAKNALTDIQTNVTGLSLLPDFASVFSTANRGNAEIIFASRNLLNEATLTFVASSFVPQSGLIVNFYDSVGNRQFNATTDNWGGLLRAPVNIATFRKYDDKDARKWATIQPAYALSGGIYLIAGCFAKKFAGEQSAGARQYTNDYPIYRYADLLLLLAEAKVVLGEDPAAEINAVRARALGSNYTAAQYGFPNQAIDADPAEAILQERLYEFVFEGKRWYDLRRMGDTYVYEHTTLSAAEAYKLLWPIDRTSLTNNRLLVQNPGYATF